MAKRYVAVALILAISLAFGTVYAESMPSSKAAAAMGDLSVVPDDGEWHPVLRTCIKTCEQKELAVDVALQCGLYTRTLARSKAGNKDTSSAEAGVKVRVVMDDAIYAEPGGEDGVVYCSRYQELSAIFQGIFQEPIDTDGDGIPDDFSSDTCLSLVDSDGDGIPDKITVDEDCLTPEEVELILNTMSAHSFNFMLCETGADVHTIEVQAMIFQDAAMMEGDAEAAATLGKGSMIIETMRMIQDADGTPALQ